MIRSVTVPAEQGRVRVLSVSQKLSKSITKFFNSLSTIER